MEKCYRSVGFGRGNVGGSGRGPFPCLHSLPFESLGALEGIRCGAARGGFLPASSGRYAVHCLADPKLHHFYDRKSGNLAAFVSGQFGHVYCRSSLFRSLTAAGTEAAGNIH